MRPLIFVMTSLAPTGGIERDAIKCLRALAQQGRPLFVIAQNLHPDVRKMFPEGSIQWHPIRSTKRPPLPNQLWLWWHSARIIESIRRQHPDACVLAFEWLPMCDIQIGGTPARLWWDARKRMHQWTWNRPTTRLWLSSIERRLKRSAYRFVVYSEMAYQAFLEDGVASEHVDRVIIPTDLECFRPTPPELPARREILLIGSDPKRKGVDIALMAWPTIRKAFPELTLNIVYNGRKIPAFADRFDLTNVTLSPLIPNPEAYYARARMVLAPSMFETWGNVVVEAAACGLPVITTQQTPACELIDTPVMGEVFSRSPNPQNDADTLSTLAIRQLKTNLDAESMHARHTRVQQFQTSHFDLVAWICRL